MVMMKWLDRDEYPFKSNYLELPGGRMHYLDEGEGPVVLMVHGTPVWSFVYRRLIKSLAPNFRCIVPDHLGFGLSDKPSSLEYTTRLHGQNLQALIDHLGLRDINLMVHDFGGPIGLRRVINNPAPFKRLIIGNTWLWSVFNEASLAADPKAREMQKILKSPLLPFLYKYLNFSPRFLIPKAFADGKKLTRGLHKHYLKPFASASQREGALGFARSLLAEDADFESLWEKRGALAELPTLLLWGMCDPFLGADRLDKWRTFVETENTSGRTRVVELAEAGHFIQEEAPEEIAVEIRSFLEAGVEANAVQAPSKRA